MQFKANFVTFDLETGGLSSEKDAIVEIACCPLNNDLKELKEYTTLIKPYGDYRITDGALKANGLTLPQIEKGKDSKIMIKELIDYLKSLKVGREKPILCGHNIDKFDIPFLDEFFSFHKQDLSKYVNEKITIDTLWWSRFKWQESANYKLGTCCVNAGVELINAHRALNDTRANKELVKKMLLNLRNDSSGEQVGERSRTKFEM